MTSRDGNIGSFSEVSENGDNVVIFDDELIELGSKKWSLTVCGQFIGCSMGFNEARYHIRRMWNKFGLRDVIVENGVFYFKFQGEDGIKEIPVWVKMRNVPMEAWSVKGISALASSIGKPVIMDEITAKMCVTGVGRVGFARVLVEIVVEKGIKDKIKIMYKSKSIAEGTKKVVEVEYSWIPCVCSHYKVFGHTDNFCKKKSKIVGDDESEKNNGNDFRVMQNRKYGREGLNVNKRNNVLNGQHNKMWYGKRHDGVNNKWNQNNRFEYKLRKGDEGKGKEAAGNKEKNVGNTNNEQANRENMKKKDNEKMNQEGSTSKENRNRNGVLGSNKFTLLNALIDEEELVPNIDQRKIVDEFLSRNKNANNGEMNGWNEMKRYFRDRKELFDAVQDIEENEDVMDENYKERNNVLRNEVEGVLDLFFVLLSEWKTDRVYSELKELRDLAWMISQSRQYIFLLIETIDKRSKFFCTMIYASNSGMERRKLWKDLEIQKVITNGIPWVILGDFNVTLKVSEHTNGSANPSSEMSEFQDCVNHIEVDDLHSEGFYYTWTKSLRNPKCRTLKKLDRIILNEAFIDKFQQAHGVFLPYMISDHSPIIVRIPNGVQKRKGSFKFSNFITDKEEFLPTVRSVWNKEFERHTMYRVVQNMKILKKKLKQLSWKNGNVFEKAENLRKEVQKEVDMLPHDENIKEKSCQILKKYYEAIQDEYSLLCQKAKVEWLKEGDRNIDNGEFKYHYGCKNLRITHLCFADDLLVFCHGDCNSVKVIKKSLDELSGLSGLVPNMQKCTVFFGGLSNTKQQLILNIIPFTVGVPLITKQINISDCKPRVNKVKAKVSDWKNKVLSYAGRVQLIASVLSSMQNYWASVFLLPKQVINEINKLLKGFLWCQGDLTKGRAKISWDAICKPKDQGGLGLKNLYVWNCSISYFTVNILTEP
ncbi:RNA-directed DNA polymerase, eukaryota, reverse transcriptase zinc-binding domain protein [Tanacetum coccineum]